MDFIVKNLRVSDLYDIDFECASLKFRGKRKLSEDVVEIYTSKPGVYLISDENTCKKNGEYIYIGMTMSSIKNRVDMHIDKMLFLKKAKDTTNWSIYRDTFINSKNESLSVLSSWIINIVCFEEICKSQLEGIEARLIFQHFRKHGNAPKCNNEFIKVDLGVDAIIDKVGLS